MPKPVNVNLTFSLEEFATLVDMIEIADWVVTAHESETTEDSEPYRALRNSILSHCKGTPLENFFECDETTGQFYETPEFDENGNHRRYIDEFENRTFWEELVERLADRDLVQEIGEEAAEAMSLQERFESREVRREDYVNEFSDHGLENLRIR